MNRETNNVDYYTNYSSVIPRSNFISGKNEDCKYTSNCHQGLICTDNKCKDWTPNIERFVNKGVKESFTLKYTTRRQNSGQNFY